MAPLFMGLRPIECTCNLSIKKVMGLDLTSYVYQFSWHMLLGHLNYKTIYFYIGYGSIVCHVVRILWHLESMFNYVNNMSNKNPTVSTIGWGSCLLKWRSLV